MLLQTENNLDKQPSTLYSYLSTNLNSGVSVIPVKNVNAFQTNWAVQLGKTGEEQSEILNTSSVGGTALNTTGTARFSHPLDTPVYQIHYDQVVFLRSTTGTTGTAAAIATVAITPDSFYTEYNDASGAATYAYQVQYYNSVSGDISGTSSWFIPGGPTFYSFQKLKSRVKNALYSANFIKNDDVIGDWVNEWLEIMTNSMIKVNQGYAMGTATYSFSAAAGNPAVALGTVTDPLFKQPYKVEVSYDGTNWTNSIEIPVNQYSSTDTYSVLQPRHAWQGDTTFIILPPGTGGSVKMTNYIRYNPLVNDTDELPQIMKSYTTSFIEYGLYKAYDLDQKTETAEAHWAKALTLQNAFVAEITPRDQSGPKLIQLTETLSGLSEDINLSTEYFI